MKIRVWFFFLAMMLTAVGCSNEREAEIQGSYPEDSGKLTDDQMPDAEDIPGETSTTGTEETEDAEDTPHTSDSVTNGTEDAESDNTGNMEVADMRMRIGDTEVTVQWEDNESVAALRDLAKDTPRNVSMSMYGGFEQVGSLGTGLPRNDTQTTTSAGDIVLYSGNQIVVFYGSNTWAYTRLGRITNLNDEELTGLLGNGDVTLTFYLE